MSIRNLLSSAGRKEQLRRKQMFSRRGMIKRLLRHEALELRQLLAADLILDFDGGTVASGQGYDLPSANYDGFGFGAFAGFDTSGGSGGNVHEQVLQTLAGVREDFAPFDVNVFWDNQGVLSALFDAEDTVVMTVAQDRDEIPGETGQPFGVASNVDLDQLIRDTAYAFFPPHRDGAFNDDAQFQLRELIDTISHEAGHTFGVSHSTESDATQQQIVTTATQNQQLDSRFSSEVLVHGGPEVGVEYSETQRLIANVGAAAVVPNDLHSSQTLPMETTLTANVSANSPTYINGGSIDFAGDRDAFRFTAADSGEYVVRQLPTAGSTLSSYVTIWDGDGDFLAGGPTMTSFTATAGATYYAVAGSAFDRLAGANTPTASDTGAYALVLGSSVTVDGAGNLIYDDADGSRNDDLTIVVEGSNYRISDPANALLAGPGTTQDGADILVPIADVTGEIRFNTRGGNDSLSVNFNGGNIVRPIVFNGGTQTSATGDVLSIINNMAPATNQTLTYTTADANGNNGNIDLDGTVITYTGLEPIDAGDAANTILNLPAASINNATLQNSANAGEIEIIDNGATFEDTVIPNPTVSLTVNLGDLGDHLQVQTLDAGFAAALTINGGLANNDAVQITNVTLDTANAGRGLWVTETETLGITGGTVSNNTAGIGGGILIDNATSGTPTTATISGTVIVDNTATGGVGPLDGGGGIYNRGGGLLNVVAGTIVTGNVAINGAGSGGGIFNDGALNVTGSTISGNSANRAGGGIEAAAGSTTVLTNVTLDNNNAGVAPATAAPGNGGGLHITGNGNATITGGSVSGNSAAAEGGGLWNGSGTMTVSGGTVLSGNVASGSGFDQGGGGIFNDGGTLNVNGGVTIDNNTANNAPGGGGGILSVGGTANVTGSTITNNDNYGIRIVNGSGNITTNTFGGNTTADLVVDGTNGADVFDIDDASVAFSANLVVYDGSVPDLDVRGLDGADTFNVSPSVDTQIFVDGGNPVAPALPGDTLNLNLPNEANVFSDKATPPNISITSTIAGNPTQPVTFASIETMLATPSPASQTVNFFGDNNNGTPQTDNLVIVGRDVDSTAALIPGAQPEFQPDSDGDNEFQWTFNDSEVYGFRNVVFLNYDSGDEVDTLEISPYADDRPQGWDIDVFYNEGLPAGTDGDQVDLLIYNTSLFGGAVSENIVVKPSGPDNGELIVTNASFGTPIVDIDYVANTDIIINDDDGFANDTDTLTLLGTDGTTPDTSGDETVVVNFTLDGTVGNNIVNVSDTVSGMLLYGIRDINNIDVVNFDLGDGNDEITILGREGGGVGADISIDTVNVFGGAGNDTLILDNTDGLSNMPGGISYHGGSGQDQLMLTGPNAVDSSTYQVGPTVDAGTVTHVRDGETQVIHFTGLEPVIDLVPAATLTIIADNAANAITYSQSELNPAWGKVAVDGFEPIHFANKTTLIIQAAGGSDEISLNNPATPTGLTGITVIGGDPTTGSDVAIVSGTVGNDTIDFAPTSDDDAIITGAGLVPITLMMVERTAIDGQGGVDTLTYTTPVGIDILEFTPGPGSDGSSGAIEAVRNVGGQLMPLTFTDVYAGAPPALTFADTSGNPTDVLSIRGTDGSNRFALTSTGDVTATDALGFLVAPRMATAGVRSLTLQGLDGDDTFVIPGDHPFATLVVEGGNPDGGSDTVEFTASATLANLVTVDLGSNTIGEATFAAVSLVGIEVVNTNAAGHNLDVDTGLGNDHTVVTLMGADAGTLVNNVAAPAVNFSNTATLAIDQQTGDDVLQVRYTSGADTIAVDLPAGLISDGVLETVNFVNANTAAVEVWGGAADDTFNVTSDPNIPVFIDGGDPIGSSAGDTLNLLAGGGAVVSEAGPETDEGSLFVAGNQRVSFDHIEALGVIGAIKAYLSGTTDDDEITVIARDGLSGPVQFVNATPGVQDFTTSVNDGLQILWQDTPQLVIDAKAGDDDIVIRAPANNNANWNMIVDVLGGTPAAGPFPKGDRLEFETPSTGTDAIIYTPTAVDGGTLVLDENVTGGYVPGDDTIINIGIIPAPMVGVPIPESGGVETLVYDGEAGDDRLTVVAPAGDDFITHTPGSDPDGGTVAVNSLLALQYSDIGLGGGVAIDGQTGNDTLTVRGTEFVDAIAVAGTTGSVSHTLSSGQSRIVIDQQNVEGLVVDAWTGDDSITVAGNHPFTSGVAINGGSPDNGSDVLVFVGSGNAITADLAARTVTEFGFGPVAITGIETVNIAADGAALTASLTNNDDSLTYRPSGVEAGTFRNEADNTTFNFSEVTDAFTVSALGSVADQVIVEGTNSHDRIVIDSPNRTATVTNAAGIGWKPVVLAADVEQITATGRLGNDTFLVVPAPTVGGIANGNLQIHIDGGQPGASDALVIATAAGGTLPASDFAVNAVGLNPGEGRVRVFRNAVAMPDISYIDVEIVSPNVVVTGGVPQLLVLGPDAYEPNEYRTTATFLDNGDSLNVDNLAIFPNFGEHVGVPADVDYFQIVAQETGTLDVTAYFEIYSPALLPEGGQLGLNVLDSAGNVIGGAGAFGNPDGTANARVRIPVVAGQTYFATVFGAAANGTANAAVVNGYELSITNEAPPVPYDLELNDILQVGTVAALPAPTTTSFTAVIAPANGVLPPTNFDYIGKTVEFTSGPNIGRTAVITSFNSGTGLFGVAAGLIAAPTTADTFVIETTDTGRSQLDNVTRDNTPIITFRLDDDILLRDLPGDSVAGNPADEIIAIPFNGSQTAGLGAAAVANAGFRVAVFIEGSPQQPGTAPQTPIGYARQLPGTPGVYIFDFGRDVIPGGAALALTDGSHFINAKVEMIDPSIDAFANDTAFGGRSVSLEIVVDTNGPTLFFGDPAITGDGLHPDSDSGDPGLPATFNDGITNDLTPTFWGHAEADAIVKAYVDVDFSGTLTPADVLIGQTVASPLDGTNQEPFGRWQLTSTVNMNDPTRLGSLPVDGLRTILITAEDPAGNQNPGGAVVQTLDIFIDTAGPQVTNVFITGSPDYNLFTLKPNNVNQGPTPAVNGLTIDLQDFPARTAAFLYAAVSNVPPLAPIVLTGDHSGIIPITNVSFTSDPLVPGSIATGFISLTFAEPLPDDRFTLTLKDNIIDPAGNALDGENNAAEPVGTPFFPTGDLIPGGDFIARFTVDSRPEVATWSQGLVYADINGNFVWDPEGQDNDATNRDFVYNFGNITDAYFVGNFADVGAASASGFDKVGSYGAWNGVYQFFLDTDDDGVQDFVSNMPAAYQVNGIPVAGDFNAAHPGDEIGLFDGQNWYLDVNGNNRIDVGEKFATTLRGLPVVGDFNGDGADDLATYNNDTGVFQFDLNRDHTTINDTLTYGFSGFNERPVAGDFNLDGADDIAMWVPGREGQLPKEAGEFHFLISDNLPAVPLVTTLPSTVFDPFSPAPLGNDRIAQFGDDFALPLLGNFDPPVSVDSGGPTALGSLTNDLNPYDTNADGVVTPLDVLHVLNALNRGKTNQVSQPLRALASFGGYYLDVSRDGNITPLDALQVINALSKIAKPSGEAPTNSAPVDAWSAAVDSVFADPGDDDEEDDLLDLLSLEQTIGE